jgi:hypothetical protein
VIVIKDYELSFRGPAKTVALDVPEESDVEWLVIAEGAGYKGRDESWEC